MSKSLDPHDEREMNDTVPRVSLMQYLEKVPVFTTLLCTTMNVVKTVNVVMGIFNGHTRIVNIDQLKEYVPESHLNSVYHIKGTTPLGEDCPMYLTKRFITEQFINPKTDKKLIEMGMMTGFLVSISTYMSDWAFDYFLSEHRRKKQITKIDLLKLASSVVVTSVSGGLLHYLIQKSFQGGYLNTCEQLINDYLPKDKQVENGSTRFAISFIFDFMFGLLSGDISRPLFSCIPMWFSSFIVSTDQSLVLGLLLRGICARIPYLLWTRYKTKLLY